MDSEGLIISTPISLLAKESADLTDQIISEKDPNKLQDLTNLFKQNQLKKNLLRTNKLNNLLEIIDDEVITRVTASPESISDRDLLSYMNSTQQSIQNSFNTFDQMPSIQINTIDNSINVTDSLDKDSRKRVLDRVNEILNTIDDKTIIDIKEED